jgi:hypothetical protein
MLISPSGVQETGCGTSVLPIRNDNQAVHQMRLAARIKPS